MASYASSGLKKLIHSETDRVSLLEGEQFLIVDRPAPLVSRITLNRPEKRNCMNHQLRGQLFNQLFLNDQDPDTRVTILRGAGKSFCAGYDLDMQRNVPLPFFQAEGDGQFQRHVLDGWFRMMDLAKPVIAAVQGYCLAGGSELASACDLIYCSESAKIGYPPVRSMGLPDTQIFPWVCGMRKAMEIMLTGDNMSGIEAAECGWATGVFADDDLQQGVVQIAERVAKIPSDLLAYNKRSVHRAMEMKGMRTHLRAGTDLQALSFHTPSSRQFMKKFTGRGDTAKKAFTKRDAKFGDNRVTSKL
uniref:Enoyl-CoA hydratase n=1 Tax=Mucochytrium quahogii TaxID=96639 RepID=A0A7S2SE92_9STRA|mmetsp:Transcript_2382/g.3452  ORF Transcript_2382/g.3452 Transcript_2382/m.3452 type:complete len:303 (+) Transcript_2382:93-1001(+)|eukprot:CAMPEP_0203786026 /NCGR_PEP_ID=MMETSP0100_2-20121128/1370_1 /ASSEMBLY_ACC=CAM_ASM_000210 /TAXON_ID=96639 /ORGANISM=" , Strain NY0313808BC1" /LENGTH=302 /DNA_ID=CAMNT_0050688227 /DNA_START=34 /DNA_END=942 /DNA_ORIENTATION=+